MKALVIGGDSYIARHFIKRYSSVFEFLVISRIPTGFSHEVIIENLWNIPDDMFLVDVVINFAAIVHSPTLTNAAIYGEVNRDLAVNNARKSKKNGVNLFLQMSSISVYGDSNTDISCLTEASPSTIYGITKLQADNEILKMSDDRFSVAVIRPPMVYGPGAPGNMLKLIRIVDKSVPLPFLNVNNERDFIYIGTLVQYLYVTIQMKLNGVFLVSESNPVSTESIVKIIGKHLSRKVFLFKVPLLLNFIKLFMPVKYNKLYCSLKISSNFPYNDLISFTSIDESLRETINHYVSNNRLRS